MGAARTLHFFCFHRYLKVVCVGTSWVWRTSLVCMRRGSPAHKGLIVDNAVEMEELISLQSELFFCGWVYGGNKGKSGRGGMSVDFSLTSLTRNSLCFYFKVYIFGFL